MKKTFTILLSALLIASFAACGAQKPATVPAPSSSEASVSDTAEIPSIADTANAGERLVVADAALFTGVIEDFAVSDDGKTVWMLKGDDGKALKAAVDENTKFSFDSSGLGNGARLEVYYSGEGDVVSAIAANRLDTPDSGLVAPAGNAPAVPADAMTYDGIVVSVNIKTENGIDGTIEMTNGKGENAYVFNFTKDSTYIGVDLLTVKPGDKLRVIHSQISTRSIPPQSPAFQILPMPENALIAEDTATASK